MSLAKSETPSGQEKNTLIAAPRPASRGTVRVPGSERCVRLARGAARTEHPLEVRPERARLTTEKKECTNPIGRRGVPLLAGDGRVTVGPVHRVREEG